MRDSPESKTNYEGPSVGPKIPNMALRSQKIGFRGSIWVFRRPRVDMRGPDRLLEAQNRL